MCAIVQSVHDAHHVLEEGESRGSGGGVNARNCCSKTRDRQTQSITSLDRATTQAPMAVLQKGTG